jgi:hypothetical protein
MATQHHPIRTPAGLRRVGLDPAPEPNLHLLGDVWIASCPSCGFQLCTARTQQRVERRARSRSCPVCIPRGGHAA